MRLALHQCFPLLLLLLLGDVKQATYFKSRAALALVLILRLGI